MKPESQVYGYQQDGTSKASQMKVVRPISSISQYSRLCSPLKFDQGTLVTAGLWLFCSSPLAACRAAPSPLSIQS